MNKSLSPLRYPGGKYKIYDKVKNLIEINELGDRSYVEPFAGGFGIGLGLLRDNIVQTAILNDFDPHIYNFWHTILNYPDDFLQLMIDTPITIEEREHQKEVYEDDNTDQISDGFATFFLNRVNFSGVITGGPIGGFMQSGTYKLDCRFNKDEIKNKIEQLALLRDRIELYNYDASELITHHLHDRIQECFFNIDPPYVEKGHRLYTNFFKEEDHRKLKRTIEENLEDGCWIVTYDDCELISDIYTDCHMVGYDILHNAGGSVQGKEVVITNTPEYLATW
ncbi:DNA adenine methylase [Christensenellaceae bacterium OttesenSCG-928-K19]|nr:DNA adenine methylase [Christensenellaceae bacterium OttesenSCG-928-K19]